MYRSLHRAALVVFAIALATGCGWHPRGALELAPHLQQLRVVSAQPDGGLPVKLERALAAAGVDIVQGAGSYALHLGEEERIARRASLDRDARSAEQEMRVQVEFDLRNAAGVVVFGPRTATASRIYAFDPNSIIAKQDEENLIFEELRDNIIGQIFRQISRAAAGPAP